MLKVLSVSNISSKRRVTIKKEILDIIGADIGDEVLFILDQNGIVNIRKFEGNVILGQNEKYISSSHIYKNYVSRVITTNSDVMQIVNTDVRDQILILDKNGNIILRNNVILGECSQNIFNKNVGALIIGLTSFHLQSGYTTLPKEIIEILGPHIRNKVVLLSLDEYGNVIVSNEIGRNLKLQESLLVFGENGLKIHLIKSIQDIINTNKILWFFDEEGNVIIKNNLLPDSCML